MAFRIHSQRFPDGRDQEHVGACFGQIETIARSLFHYRWSKRAKAFAELDLQIQLFLHVGTAGIAKNGTVPQRARTKFHPTLEPTNHLLFLEKRGHAIFELVVG